MNFHWIFLELRGHQYDFVEDWFVEISANFLWLFLRGEAYINKSVSSLFLLDLTTDSINQLSGLPSDIASVGQVSVFFYYSNLR